MKKTITDYLKDFNESADTARKNGGSGNSRAELDAELERIEKEYQASIAPIVPETPKLPDVPEYERLEYDAPTDEELRARAESELSDYKASSVSGIDEQTEAAKRAKAEEKAAALAAAEQRAQTVAEGYDAATRAFENDSLKRGLARSSIAVNKSAELAGGRADELARAAAEAEEETRNIDGEIAALEVSRTKALDSFNIAYAAKLTEKIADLTTARDKKSSEVTQYNNTLLELERKAANERAELQSKLNLTAESNATTAVDPADALTARNISKYNAIRSYLAAMSKSDAASALRSDSGIRDTLTDYYYYKLYNEFVK